ncbi:MAG TPA: hypothetical protein VGB50_11260 [Flavobacterium sp.]|jgi:hypothetical protein
MKKFYLLILATLVSGCFWPGSEELENPYEPVVMDRPEFENSLQALPVQPMTKSGKIYIYNFLMFINDARKGFHVYNYSDPENPVEIGFINAPGATDLAMRNNIIYINQAVDLVTLSYNPDNNTIAFLHRNKNVFPQMVSPWGSAADVDDDEIVVDWHLN